MLTDLKTDMPVVSHRKYRGYSLHVIFVGAFQRARSERAHIIRLLRRAIPVVWNARLKITVEARCQHVLSSSALTYGSL